MKETNSRFIFSELINFISNDAFSCVAAKTACYKNTVVHRDFKKISDATILSLHKDISQFSDFRPGLSLTNATFIATFSELNINNEVEFDRWIWSLLQRLHDLDVSEGYYWAKETSSCPNDPNFSFSIAGEAYFIVGLHPHSSRISRTAPFPTIAFNSRKQFSYLKSSGIYGKLQSVIRSRELELQGSINPNLNEFGLESEARQYSGIPTNKNWKCPFVPRLPIKEAENEK